MRKWSNLRKIREIYVLKNSNKRNVMSSFIIRESEESHSLAVGQLHKHIVYESLMIKFGHSYIKKLQ